LPVTSSRNKILVTPAERPHPFPSRTRKLSSPAPKILRGQPLGKIGRRQDLFDSSQTARSGERVEKEKSRAAKAGDQTGERDAAQRLAAYLRGEAPADAHPVDAEPPDADPVDAEPPDAESQDAESPGTEPPREYRPSGLGPVSSVPHGRSAPLAASAWGSICPYLLDESGTWRAAQPSRDHRCTGITPPEPLRAERQRRLCLGAGHLDCPIFLVARESRARSLGEVAAVRPGRPFARTAPVILQRPGAVAVALSMARTSLPQLGLVILMLLGAAALLFARFITP
jgi:hypothetical protein